MWNDVHAPASRQPPEHFIPAREIHFFDVDNLIQHPDFFFYDGRKWHYPSLDDGEYWAWYRQFFKDAREDQLIGEDSTTYLASEVAPERIANAGKDIKIIIMLRDPAERAYSHYWHLVRTGRATQSFEETLQRHPASVLDRSLYERQILNVLRFIPRERVHVVLFEDFVKNVEPATRRTCDFLGVDASLIDVGRARSHANAGQWPRYQGLQLWRNRALRNKAKFKYRSHLVDQPGVAGSPSLAVRLADKAHALVNPLQTAKRPRMRPETRAMLDDFFSVQNARLADIIGVELQGKWYRSRGRE